jgi:ABC-2 type transport system permease protein
MKNKMARELNAVITLVGREIILALKSPGRILMGILWPAMMLGMFGGQLSQNMGMNMEYNFNTFMLIGMLVQGLFMVTATSLNSLVEDRGTDFTQEILVSPVSRYSIIFGKIIGCSFTAYIQFFATLVIGLLIGARLSIAQLILMIAVSPLMCLASGAFTLLFIGLVRKASTAAMIIMLVSMSQTFLSGALIPVNHSTGVLALISRLLPMTYCIDLARGLFYGGGSGLTLHSPPLNLAIIMAFTVVFFTVGTTGFVRSEKNR